MNQENLLDQKRTLCPVAQILGDHDQIKALQGPFKVPARRAGPASKLILWHLLCEIISRPLICQKYKCYIVIEVIEVDDLDESNILVNVLVVHVRLII